MRALCFLTVLFFSTALFGEGENSVILSIKPQPDDFFEKIVDGKDQNFAKSEESDYIVIGLMSAPSFVVSDINKMEVRDSEGKNLPLLAEKASIYSEFDDGKINSLRLGFAVSQKSLEKGPVKLVWGESVAGDTKLVEVLSPYADDRERYRSFVIEQRPAGDANSSFSASINVIVDNYADKYYVWYMLPLVLIFMLLALGKYLRRKE